MQLFDGGTVSTHSKRLIAAASGRLHHIFVAAFPVILIALIYLGAVPGASANSDVQTIGLSQPFSLSAQMNLHPQLSRDEINPEAVQHALPPTKPAPALSYVAGPPPLPFPSRRLN